MRRIWNIFSDGKQPPQGQQGQQGQHAQHAQHGHTQEDGSDEDTVEKSTVATQTPPPHPEDPVEADKATTPVKESSVNAREKSKAKRGKKNKSKDSAEKKPKKMSLSKERIPRSREKLRKEEEPKHVVIAEAREIAAREDNEEFENEGGGILAKTRIKQRDLKWKEETSSEERRRLKATPKKKIIEARDINKADDEEFENDGAAPMARSKIKTRDLIWKAETPEESPQKERSVEDRSKRTPRKSRVKVSEAREVNKADDEEFENDGGASMARSKIKTRDLKWKDKEQTEASPGKTPSGSDSGGDNSTKTRTPKRKASKPKIIEARDVNKADDEEFENDGAAPMARSKIKTRDLKWKEEDPPKKPKVIEARDVNKADDEEFENDSGGTMAKSKIKSRDLKWKKDEDAGNKSREVITDDAKSPVPRMVEARDVNKADDEEFENDSGGTMAKSKIKSRDLQWKSPVKEAVSAPAGTPTPEKTAAKHKITSPTDDKPARSLMQQLTPEKKKETPTEKTDPTERTERSTERTERTERSAMLPPPSPSHTPQSTVRKEVKEGKIDKSGAARSKHRKEEKKEEKETDKSFARKIRSRISQTRNKSKNRSDKSANRDQSEPPTETSPSPQQSPDKSSKSSSKDSSKRLDVVAVNAVDKSVRSIKNFFKVQKTDDTKKTIEELLPKVERDSKDTYECRRLMEMFKRNNVFENALFPYQNETLRAHFQSGSRRLDKNTMDLLFKATDFVLDKILYRGEELDEFIDNPLKAFILNRNKSRTMVVEYLLKHPEFLPQSWGGRTVVLMRSEEEVSVMPENEKSKNEPRSPHSKDK